MNTLDSFLNPLIMNMVQIGGYAIIAIAGASFLLFCMYWKGKNR